MIVLELTKRLRLDYNIDMGFELLGLVSGHVATIGLINLVQN